VEFKLPPDPRIGTVLSDRYRIDALIGEGGMGKVYAAEHIAMHKKLAVKVLHRELSTVPELVARFEREAMAAANVDHPNVAIATDFGKLEDDAVFIAFELVEGRCLRDVIAAGPIPVRRALGIARQVASALGAAQALSIVHRDLKPENVMLIERDGDPDFVKVLDFGVAKVPIGEPTAGGQQGAITRIGTVFGTPEYIPPEQALGQPSDGRADLYSLGVMLYEMLTGVRPFTSTSKVNLVGMHLGEPAPKLEDRAPGLGFTDELEALVAQLLKKSAADRPAHAADVIRAIDEILGKPLRKPFPSTHGIGFVGVLKARLADLRVHARPLFERLGPLRSGAAAAFERGVAAIERGRQRLPPPLARAVSRVPSSLLAKVVLGLAGAVVLLALIGIVGSLRGPKAPEAPAPAASASNAPVAPAPERLPSTTPGASAPQPAPSAAAPADASLEALLAKIKASAYAKDHAAAVAAGKAALELNPAAKNDGRLAAALFQAAQDKKTLEPAFLLLEGPMQDKGAGVIHDLAVFAPKGSPAQRRAEAWLGSPRFTLVAAPALRLAVAMRRARTCKEVRALLPEVKTAGDKQSLPYLKFFSEHLKSYPCLKQDQLLNETMRVINARAASLESVAK
jgi:eukaryotic-like serine/threonine-protein kinase